MGETNGSISTYKEEYVEKVDEYLGKKKDTKEKFVKQKNIEKGYEMFGMKLKVNLPSVRGFAKYIDVARKSLYNWEKEHGDFRIALDKIREEQRERLINMGLSGDYNSTIAKLILSSNHGMKERSDVTSDDEQIDTFNDKQIDRIAKRVADRKGSDGDAPSTEESD